ncbi:SgcJ/EcaC family oxidoreductase [Nostoc sp.]|uniref:SgcJ/EcaC family oxidoreductase n=1 Tax=Nostoc sp. TaxID=1180 RepID=UPI002FF8A6CB
MSTTETSAKDEAAIKAVIAAFAEAWNTKDAEPLAKLFAEDADFVDVIGRWFKGRTEIKQAHAQAFASFLSDSQMTIIDTPIKFLTPDIAVLHTTWEITKQKSPDGVHRLQDTGVLTAVTTRKENTWQIIAFHNTGTVPIPDLSVTK